ncbi:hypothetical protein [Aeromonas hydrophila]|uniref:hypothetical protein n=1 Tax=Aeromonas hydrophila TaxID=644 RepID=UPI00069412F1|nr:hypothetical protein [Aeromonas hydrophila]QPR86488.1 hypothetical protein I6G73_13385 [Aeromonas hydrophila]UON51590.1 hypothetical protein IUJ49_12535 [Aeromonas hydrophila]
MERLKDILASLIMEPEVLKVLGGLLMILSLFALSLGVRELKLQQLLESLFSRLHTMTDGKAALPPPGLFDQWPIIQAMIPETFIGFLTWASFFAAGWMMVDFGKQTERMY